MIARTVSQALLAVVLILFPSPQASADGAPAQPTSQPAIDAMLAQLGSDDPMVRDHADQELMGMRAADLPLLRQAIQTAPPLPPGETQAIRDIVTQVFLADHPADGDSTRGFMGIEMSGDDTIHFENDSDPDLAIGVFVNNRVPGYAAYQMLRNGDLILSISSPELQDGAVSVVGDDPHEHRVRVSRDIIELVRTLAPGNLVTLSILRSGQRMRITFALGARPLALPAMPGPGYQQYWNRQLAKAAEYWNENFAGLMDRAVL